MHECEIKSSNVTNGLLTSSGKIHTDYYFLEGQVGGYPFS